MRPLQRHPLTRLLVSILLAAGLTFVATHLTSPIVAVLVFPMLVIAAFATLTIAPDLIALQRRHYWRWWWRTSDDDGPFWPVTRIPRGPRGPA
jgi:hypothetical protein